MKKYEYNYFNIPALIEARRIKEKSNESSEGLFIKILNELGADGWELIPQGNGYFGKKEYVDAACS